MAPPPFNFEIYTLHARQEDPQAMQLSACVQGCLDNGDSTGCANATDYACICKSTVYANSVASCWVGQQCAQNDITLGIRYTNAICQPLISGNTTTATNGTGIEEVPSPDLTGTPQLFQKEFVKVQAVMSSICAAVLAIALILGFLACRSRLRADREAADRSTWSGAATYTETKNGGRSQINTRGFDPTVSGFDTTTSFSAMRGDGPSVARTWAVADRPSVNRGFTNRLALEEEIEMSATNTPDSPGSRDEKEDIETPLDTPTTFTTKMEHSEVDVEPHSPNGSTVELTPKNQQGEFKKGVAF